MHVSSTGVIHGKTIELEHEPGLPEGQRVSRGPSAGRAPGLAGAVRRGSLGTAWEVRNQGDGAAGQQPVQRVEEGHGDEELGKVTRN